MVALASYLDGEVDGVGPIDNWGAVVAETRRRRDTDQWLSSDKVLLDRDVRSVLGASSSESLRWPADRRFWWGCFGLLLLVLVLLQQGLLFDLLVLLRLQVLLVLPPRGRVLGQLLLEIVIVIGVRLEQLVVTGCAAVSTCGAAWVADRGTELIFGGVQVGHLLQFESGLETGELGSELGLGVLEGRLVGLGGHLKVRGDLEVGGVRGELGLEWGGIVDLGLIRLLRLQLGECAVVVLDELLGQLAGTAAEALVRERLITAAQVGRRVSGGGVVDGEFRGDGSTRVAAR